MNPVYYNDEEYQEILQHLNSLTEEAEMLPYPNAKELTTNLLQYFDLVHREALARMMQLIDSKQPQLRKELEADFTIKTLLSLYDLSATTNGVVPTEKPLGQVGFVPVEQVMLIRPILQTVWTAAGKVSDYQENQLYAKELAGDNVLICKIDKQIYAVRNACLDSILPMQFGTIEGHHLICPWHGCRYDLPTGRLVDTPKEKLETYRVAIDKEGTLSVGMLKEQK